MGGRRLISSVIAAFAGLLVVAPAAQATFHEMSIREVYPGSSIYPDAAYIELQMYAAGQNLVGGHALTVYNNSGALIGTFTFSGNVANANNQQTILIGDSGVQAVFGVIPDLIDPGLSVPGGGGAACWAGSIDCVAWGSFSGSTPSSLSVGTPADSGGIPDGMALRRTIAPGCPTLLEATDDTNSSLTDFFDATPNPRSNATPPTETTCVVTPPPTTTIDSKPANPTKNTDATFTYHANQTGATFQCSLDGAAFSDCSTGSTISYPGPIAEGSHTFQVKATNGNGTGAAASYTWKIDTTPPTATIDSHPADPSAGGSATFTFHSSELNSTFQCSLAKGATADSFSACSSGKTYTNLADDTYTFKVRATDPAGNQGDPASFSWTVDNSLADTTPPETAIDTKPPDPSTSSEADFTYHSSEGGSTFQCKLDGAAFTSCQSSGIAYTGLSGGSHTFQVRATDASSNTDPTPAGYTFNVSLFPSNPSPDPLPIPTTGPQRPPAPPQTKISLKPAAKTRDRTPTFRFSSSPSGSSFECKLDGGAFRLCRSPFTSKVLAFGRHTLKVRAIRYGAIDPTPATVSFKVVKR